MKALFFLPVWMMFCSMTAVGQSCLQSETDISKKIKSINPYTFSLDHSQDVKAKLRVPFDTKNLSCPGVKNKLFTLSQQKEEKLKDLATMPVLKPKDRYYMPVFKPDTTVQFSLLIKEYPRFQNKQAK